jgi:hypothetical protein
VLTAAVGELVSDEIRVRLDRIPLVLLAAAARRLPHELRGELYGQAWLPELHHILQGDRAMPITRLIHGTRYALRLWLSAPLIGQELSAGIASRTLSKRILLFVFSPTYVVAINLSLIPLASAAIAYAAYQPSWSTALIAAAMTMTLGRSAISGRRALIKRHGYVPSREMLCQCIVSTTIRALVVPVTVIATSAMTFLACRANASSGPSIIDAMVMFGFFGAHIILMRLGFGLRVDTSE